MISYQDLKRIRESQELTKDSFEKGCNFVMRNADRTIRTDAQGYPMMRAYTRRRALLPAPDNLVDWERPTNRQYTDALAEVTSSNISKQAKEIKINLSSALLDVQPKVQNLFQAAGVFSFIESYWLNGRKYPVVTEPLYLPVADHITIGDFSNANRTSEKSHFDEFYNLHHQLEKGIIVLLDQMIDTGANPDSCMQTTLRGKATSAWDFYQAIEKAIVDAEGTADSIRLKCQVMAGVDLSKWSIKHVQKAFDELFLKFKSANNNISFTEVDKVGFLTKLYDRCPHKSMRLLNDTLKNAITIGSAHSYLEICNLLDTKEKELRIIAADMIQAEQKLFEYNKESIHERNLYLPVSNTTTHMITTLGKQTNGITSSTANNTANFQSTVNATNGSFKENCHNCGMPGHIASHCYKSQFDKFIDRNQSRNRNQPRDFRERSNSNDRDRDLNYDRGLYQDRESGRERDRENDRDRYDQSPSPHPARDRSRSRDRSPYALNQSYRSKHNNSVANSTVLQQQEEVPTAQNSFRTPPEWELLERQEEDNKKYEQSRQVQLTDNSRQNDNTNYDTRPVKDSRRVTYANRP